MRIMALMQDKASEVQVGALLALFFVWNVG